MRPSLRRWSWVAAFVAAGLGDPHVAAGRKTASSCPGPLRGQYVVTVENKTNGVFRGLFVTDHHYHVADHSPLDLIVPDMKGGFRTVQSTTDPTIESLGARFVVHPLRNHWPIGPALECQEATRHGKSYCRLPPGRYRLSATAGTCTSGVLYPGREFSVGQSIRKVKVTGLQAVPLEHVTGTVLADGGNPASGSATVTFNVYPSAYDASHAPTQAPRPLFCTATASVAVGATFDFQAPQGSFVDIAAEVANASGTCGPDYRGEANNVEVLAGGTTQDVQLATQIRLGSALQIPTTTVTSTSTTMTSITTTSTSTTSTSTTSTIVGATTSTTSTTVTTTTTLPNQIGPIPFTLTAFPTDANPLPFFDGSTFGCTTTGDGSFTVRVPPNSSSFMLLKPETDGRGTFPFQPLRNKGADTQKTLFTVGTTDDSSQLGRELKHGCPISGHLRNLDDAILTFYGFSEQPRCHDYQAADLEDSIDQLHFYGVTVGIDGDPQKECWREFGSTTTTVSSTSTTRSVTTTSVTTTSTLVGGGTTSTTLF